jgi:hypothetical protein
MFPVGANTRVLNWTECCEEIMYSLDLPPNELVLLVQRK